MPAARGADNEGRAGPPEWRWQKQEFHPSSIFELGVGRQKHTASRVWKGWPLGKAARL